jgi:5'-nucleotidase
VKANRLFLPLVWGVFAHSLLSAGVARALVLNLTHFSDGESSLLTRTGTNVNTGQPFQFGGASLFKSLIDRQQSSDPTVFNLKVNAGDLIIPGPQFSASLERFKTDPSAPFYDTIAVQALGLDVISLGNHDFDAGPAILTKFLDPTGSGQSFVPTLGANLAIPSSNPLSNLVQSSTVITKNINGVNESIGVVGVVTPLLKSISSPGDVVALGDQAGTPGFQTLVDIVQNQVNNLTNQGINKIVLLSHLQTLDQEEALARQLQNVDIIVAAGSSTRMANPSDRLLPLVGETIQRSPYPLVFDSAAGQQVSGISQATGSPILVVSTDGSYEYLGNLKVNFDNNGVITAILPGSAPIPNDTLPYTSNGLNLPPLIEDPVVKAQVQDPVAAFVENLRVTAAATTDVPLNSLRAEVRSRSTLTGSLIADAVRESARQSAANSGGLVDPSRILVGIQNGGGIRNDLVFQPGNTISRLDTYTILPFTNLISVVRDFTGAELLSTLERAVSSQVFNSTTGQVTGMGGQFLQVSGLRFTYDPTRTAQVVQGNNTITNPGSRISRIFLDPTNSGGGQLLFDRGQGGFLVNPNDPLFDLAVINFTANGGDNFITLRDIPEARKLTFSTPGITYQEAFESYISNNLGGTITASEIPNGANRITASVPSVPEPSGLVGIGAIALVGLVSRARRR